MKHSEREVLARVEAIVQEVLSDRSIGLSPSTTASEVDGWDSISHLSIIWAVEGAFAVKFTIREIARLSNVGDLVSLVLAKIS